MPAGLYRVVALKRREWRRGEPADYEAVLEDEDGAEVIIPMHYYLVTEIARYWSLEIPVMVKLLNPDTPAAESRGAK